MLELEARSTAQRTFGVKVLPGKGHLESRVAQCLGRGERRPMLCHHIQGREREEERNPDKKEEQASCWWERGKVIIVFKDMLCGNSGQGMH